MTAKNIREAILNSDDRKPEPVEIPEWKVNAFVRPLDGESRFKLSQIANSKDSDSENSRIVEAYVCEGLVDEDGEHIFDIEERELLSKKDPAVVQRICDRVMKISGMSIKDEAEAEKK